MDLLEGTATFEGGLGAGGGRAGFTVLLEEILAIPIGERFGFAGPLAGATERDFDSQRPHLPRGSSGSPHWLQSGIGLIESSRFDNRGNDGLPG